MTMDPILFRSRTGLPIELREATPDDAEAILAHLRRVGGETDYLTFGPEGPPITLEEEREHLRRFHERENALFLIALSEGRVVAALSFEGGNRPRTRHVGEFGVSVAQAVHGGGVGGRMLDVLLEWARRGGVLRKINLRVRVDNRPAISLYERKGFRVEGMHSRDTCVDEIFHDVFAMGLEL
jgi:RimJ/RimL family protein N-acetyltransferase